MPKKYLFLILSVAVIGVIIFFSSFSNSGSNASNSSTNFETISNVKDLKTRLDQKNSQDVLLDVRTPQEFADGHISGAINLNLESGSFDSEIQKLDREKTYIVFCRSGSRALVASQKMSGIGLKTIYVKEGITSWLASGFTTVN